MLRLCAAARVRSETSSRFSFPGLLRRKCSHISSPTPRDPASAPPTAGPARRTHRMSAMLVVEARLDSTSYRQQLAALALAGALLVGVPQRGKRRVLLHHGVGHRLRHACESAHAGARVNTKHCSTRRWPRRKMDKRTRESEQWKGTEHTDFTKRATHSPSSCMRNLTQELDRVACDPLPSSAAPRMACTKGSQAAQLSARAPTAKP